MKKRQQTAIEVSPGVSVSVGALVRYYLDGYRCGYLESIHGATVKVRPIGAKNGSPPRAVTVPITDIGAV